VQRFRRQERAEVRVRGRQVAGIVIFAAGVLLPVFVRFNSGSDAAVYAIPFAAILVLIGGFLWVRR
jgi:hypothetical protein